MCGPPCSPRPSSTGSQGPVTPSTGWEKTALVTAPGLGPALSSPSDPSCLRTDVTLSSTMCRPRLKDETSSHVKEAILGGNHQSENTGTSKPTRI